MLELRRQHAGWAEADARAAAAWGARMASRACEVATEAGSALPGPALQAVADVLLAEGFDCWKAMTVPIVTEC